MPPRPARPGGAAGADRVARAGRIEVEVGERWLRVSPPPEESLGALVALRIALDHGAAVERAEGSLTLTWLR
jgi:hypothetical protein